MNDDTLTGRQLGNFKLERILGRGGMGQVYYGHDVKLNRPVAVKVIDARFRSNPAYAQRFVREAQAVATWRHENIAQVYYADEQDDLYFFAMEYIDGRDLGQVLESNAETHETMPRPEILRITRAIASAIDYAHSKDVVHRDVKPANVIIAHDGRVVLTDFGLALDTQQGSVGEVFGSANYIAPEQARRSSEATPQSDIYSLGVILFEMLTGSIPFDDPSPTSVALLHIMQPPPAPSTLNPTINPETEAVLLKALSKLPAERYPTGQALIDALEGSFKQHEPPTHPLPPLPAAINAPISTNPSAVARPVVVEKKPAATAKRNPAPMLALGGCLLLLMFFVIGAGLLLANPLLKLLQASTPAKNTPVRAISSVPTAAAGVTVTVQATGENPSVIGGALPTATVQYPNGSHFTIYYNDNSLYFLNLSQTNLPINWVAFERLSNAGAALNRFNGSRWAEFYGTSTPNKCMALKILDSAPYLDPAECGRKNEFLSLRTPVRGDETIFWTTQDGSQQFRVLWRKGGTDEEVARCEISAGKCEVFLP